MLPFRFISPWVSRAARLALLILVLAGPLTAQRSGQGGTRREPEEYEELWKRGEYEKALELVDRMVNEFRRIPVKWMTDRAELKFQTGDLEGAIDDHLMLERQVSFPPHTLRLALLYLERGDVKGFNDALDRAWKSLERYRKVENVPEIPLAEARIRELRGEDVKFILRGPIQDVIDGHPDHVPALLQAGDLARRKNDYSLAEEYYAKALKIDAESMEALHGLAEVQWRSGDPRAAGTLDALEKINPRHPGAAALRARALLDQGRTGEALTKIEDGLTLNEHDGTLRGLQAAAYFLNGDDAAAARVRKDELAFNPRRSEVFREPAELAARRYRFEDAVALLRRAVEVNPDDLRSRAELGFNLLRLGEEAEGRKQLEQVFAKDAYNVHVFNMLNLLDTLAKYEKVRRGDFELSLPANEAPILADDALNLLEEARERLTADYEVKLTTPVLVQMFDNHDDFMVRSVGLPGGTGFLGICFGRVVTMDSPTARPPGSANWRSVLWHEFAHVVTLQKTRNRMPRWLSEGLSVYEETRRDPAWGQRRDPAYKTILDESGTPGMEEIEAFFTGPESPLHLMFGYFAAGEFARFYAESMGWTALRDALRRIGEGEPAEAALSGAAGLTPEALDAAFAKALEPRLAPYENLPAGEVFEEFHDEEETSATLAMADSTSPTLAGAEPTTGTLAADALTTPGRPAAEPPPLSPWETAIGEADKAMEAGDWRAAAESLWVAHGLFPDETGEDSPLARLADLYEKHGDAEGLRRALETRMSLQASDLKSCRRLAGMAADRGDWPEAVKWGDWAMGIQPFDPGARNDLAEARVKAGDSRGALADFAKLIRLEPHRAMDLRIRRVDLLMELGDWAEARRETIGLLERAPHYWEAQRRLLEIVRHGKETALAPAP